MNSVNNVVLGYAGLSVVVIGNILGTYFMKYGALLPKEKLVLLGLFGWPTVLGLLLFMVTVVVYAWALRHIDLHVAQAIVAVQYAGAIFLSVFFFKENIAQAQWLGLGLILVGLFFVVRA